MGCSSAQYSSPRAHGGESLAPCFVRLLDWMSSLGCGCGESEHTQMYKHTQGRKDWCHTCWHDDALCADTLFIFMYKEEIPEKCHGFTRLFIKIRGELVTRSQPLTERMFSVIMSLVIKWSNAALCFQEASRNYRNISHGEFSDSGYRENIVSSIQARRSQKGHGRGYLF